jgi:predicted nucleotidyltransferase
MMGQKVRIDIHQGRIAAFCKRHHIRTLSVFGSVLRDDFGADSDVDVLVEFDPAHIPALSDWPAWNLS